MVNLLHKAEQSLSLAAHPARQAMLAARLT
jgi:hypothetical protein